MTIRCAILEKKHASIQQHSTALNAQNKINIYMYHATTTSTCNNQLKINEELIQKPKQKQQTSKSS